MAKNKYWNDMTSPSVDYGMTSRSLCELTPGAPSRHILPHSPMVGGGLFASHGQFPLRFGQYKLKNNKFDNAENMELDLCIVLPRNVSYMRFK